MEQELKSLLEEILAVNREVLAELRIIKRRLARARFADVGNLNRPTKPSDEMD